MWVYLIFPLRGVEVFVPTKKRGLENDFEHDGWQLRVVIVVVQPKGTQWHGVDGFWKIK